MGIDQGKDYMWQQINAAPALIVKEESNQNNLEEKLVQNNSTISHKNTSCCDTCSAIGIGAYICYKFLYYVCIFPLYAWILYVCFEYDKAYFCLIALLALYAICCGYAIRFILCELSVWRRLRPYRKYLHLLSIEENAA